MTGAVHLPGLIGHMTFRYCSCLLLLCLTVLGREPATLSHQGFETRVVEGWTVLISEPLVKTKPEVITKALQVIGGQLATIKKAVPARAVRRLQQVPLWLTPPPATGRPTGEYHPEAGWLRENGRDTAMAKGIQFSNLDIIEREAVRMPQFVLHELSHAYHDQVLGFDRPDIIAAYQKARDSGKYDRVERWNGAGRTNTFERAYAMANHKEYFAECTEAYFGRNDFYPFTRSELEKHDPSIVSVLEKVWNEQPGPKSK